MLAKFDQTDGQLIHLLQQNARESTATLARKLGLARTTVVARLGRLERTGIILGYGVRLGSQFEEGAVRAYCTICVFPHSTTGVIRALERMVEVEEVSSVSGQFDYLAFLRCTTHERLDDLLDRIGNLEGVKQTQTSIILARKIDRR
ncbi:Lrp/AsnC family transcriptional regulator [Pseudomonas oryzihabitans]|uniref:Lrp/AsnC family transcriptional regulator n=1 Tax=Pseudomonas oryzihabitans TaxID=47885 RepID=UPI002865DE19|nr:Lrp/AsnC family transcriptional regulator [Pseudomonas psychrotolerans]MDR6676692.1 DNA-binding Lrp family transcriptional regulator [Pseudomonas psychrotolerans]